ncbi:MAG: hypothetical protein ACR2RB_23025 [Gammaproteobacteria bacterium]
MLAIPDFNGAVVDHGMKVSRDFNGNPKHYVHEVSVRSDAAGDQAREFLYDAGYKYKYPWESDDRPMCLYIKSYPLPGQAPQQAESLDYLWI